jgi:hypothetical protein
MTTQKERADYIVSLYQKLNPEKKISANSEIKNTTIWRLCETTGGPFQRIKKWCEQKIENLEGGEDVDLFKQEMSKNFELFKGRNKKYGDSWKVMRVQSIANLCEMKLNRISNMDKLEPKIEDELRDVSNYMIFALLKLIHNK